MSRPPLNRRYYVLALLSFVLGILVLFATLILTVASYLRDIDKTVAGFGHMASSVEAALIHEMVQVNERQLAVLEASLDKPAIARGEPANNPGWAIAHQIKRGNHYIYFYNPQSDLISSYPEWVRPSGYRASVRPWYKVLSMPGDKTVWLGPYPEYSTRELILTLVKRVRDDKGHLLGLLMVDMSFKALQQALKRTVGNNRAALYLTLRGSDELIVGSHLELLDTEARQVVGGHNWFGLDVLWRGTHIKRELEEIGWDLNIYLPPSVFRDGLKESLLMVVPLLSLFLIWFLSIGFLVRIFRQEQALVSGCLSGIVQDPATAEPVAEANTWFVHSSLSEIDQVRATFLKDQDALLRDPLTGSMNRRAFEQHKLAFEQGETHFWLLLFDVDSFKGINDTLGHAFGDQVLVRVAHILAEELGENAVYRIGGDEFAALVQLECSELEAALVHLHYRVRSQEWREFKGRVTLSAGGASHQQDGTALFERADALLYQSKRSGRDCWHLSAGGDVIHKAQS
ncbi:GGDEF domain-containing protein [Aeromonas sobria]|nr:GGDEF domain-containing protein [Aeromonas sobria]